MKTVLYTSYYMNYLMYTFFILSLSYMPSFVQAEWHASIFVERYEIKQKCKSIITIGVSENQYKQASPPPPYSPCFAAIKHMNDNNINENLKEHIQQKGSTEYTWKIGINPVGDFNEPILKNCDIRWNPMQLSHGSYQLFERIDDVFQLTVENMKTISEYNVSKDTNGELLLLIRYTPYEHKEIEYKQLTGAILNNRMWPDLYTKNVIISIFASDGSFSDLAGKNASVAFEDIDHDNDVDMFFVSQNEIHLFTNVGNPVFHAWKYKNTDITSFDYQKPRICFTDIDSDNDSDMLVAYSEGIAFYRNFERTFTLDNTNLLPNSFDPSEITHKDINVMDIDNDKKPELIVSYLQKNDPTFNFYKNISTSKTPTWKATTYNFVQCINNFPDKDKTAWAPFFSDMDNDGDADLLIGHASGIRYCQNIGNSVDPEWIYKTHHYAQIPGHPDMDLTLIDIDDDGDKDIFTTTSNGNMYCYLNQAPHIEITPMLKTCRFDENVLFDCKNCQAPVTWSLSKNNSNATIDSQTGSYTAGRISAGYTYEYKNKPMIIPDNNEQGIETELTIFNGVTVNELMIYVNLNHPSPKDICLYLTSPQNKTLKLIDQIASDTVFLSYYFDQHSIFSGNNSSGVWKLKAIDAVDGNIGSLQEWSLVINGGRKYLMDTIEVKDKNGNKGKAFINVISEFDFNVEGKAIIISGIDSAVNKFNKISEYVCKILIKSGYRNENVLFLKHGDIDINQYHFKTQKNTLANIDQAFSEFADHSDELIVCLIGHGFVDDQNKAAGMNLNENENLYAKKLDTLLDNFQARTAARAIVFVDTCYSGNFMNHLTPYPENTDRIVMTSSQPEQNSYIISGLISFSGIFFTCINSGTDVLKAYQIGSDTMSLFEQNAILDISGDGIYQPDIDNQTVENYYIGSAYIRGLNAPQIKPICQKIQIESGTKATLLIDSIDSNYAIKNVWAEISFPDDNPYDPENPVKLDLNYYPNNHPKCWEVDYHKFVKSGLYTIKIYAQDIWNNVSLPGFVFVNKRNSNQKAVLITGYNSKTPETLRQSLNNIGDYTYNIFLSGWFSTNDIAYLNPDTRPPLNVQNVSKSIKQMAEGADQLICYITGDAENDGVWLNDYEKLKASDLKTLIQNARIGSSVIILDFSYSGNWMGELNDIPGNHILISSTQENSPFICELEGYLSFTYFFMNYIFLGNTISDALLYVKDQFGVINSDFYSGSPVYFQFEADGDNNHNENIDDYCSNVGSSFIGSDKITSSMIPQIINKPNNFKIMTNDPQPIWANVIPFNNQISSVWAYILRPDHIDSDHMDKIVLFYNSKIQQYGNAYQFDVPGVYNIYIYAQDLKRNVSFPERINVIKSSDIYENDDTKNLAHLISIGDSQDRTFHHCNDIDFVKFYCMPTEQARNRIDVINKSSNAILMKIKSSFNLSNDPKETIIPKNKTGYITWLSHTDDIVLIELSPLKPEAFTDTILYKLMLSLDSTGEDGRLEGKITDSFGRCLKNPFFRTSNSEYTPAYTIFPNGHFLIHLPSGTHTVISGINDKTFDRHIVQINKRSTTIQNFSPPFCDINFDGKVTVKDAILAFKVIAGEVASDIFTETCDNMIADVENIVDIHHLIYILKNISN